MDNPIKIPFIAEYHFVLEADSPGIYEYSIFRYNDEMPDKMEIEQSRYSIRANPAIFTHYGIEDLHQGDRLGEFPDTKEIATGETLMDATTRLPNGDVYTKYNHSVFGENIGVSIIRPSSEYMVSGPWNTSASVARVLHFTHELLSLLRIHRGLCAPQNSRISFAKVYLKGEIYGD